MQEEREEDSVVLLAVWSGASDLTFLCLFPRLCTRNSHGTSGVVFVTVRQ
jgi:hypothetical protein